MTERTELEKLKGVINEMDCLSQGGFSQISSIAKLALASLETPDGCLHPDNIANALQTISAIAADIQNCINCSAEEVGCNYKDEKLMRRYAANQAAREEMNRRASIFNGKEVAA